MVDEQEERLRAIGFRQNLGSIAQKSASIDKDVWPIEEEGDGGIEEKEDERGAGEKED